MDDTQPSRSAASDVEVVYAPVVAPDHVRDLLTAAEADGLGRHVRAEDRARHATGRALLRAVVAARWGVRPVDVRLAVRCAVCGGPHGKPEPIPAPGRPRIGVSVSHSGPWAAVAVAGGPVGLDLESRTGALFAGFDDVALSATERRALASLPPDRRDDARTRLWARKEALLKAHGLGLSVEPSSLTVGLPDGTGAVIDGPLRPSTRTGLADLDPVDGYVGCVALPGDAVPRVRLVDGRALLAVQAGAARTATA